MLVLREFKKKKEGKKNRMSCIPLTVDRFVEYGEDWVRVERSEVLDRLEKFIGQFVEQFQVVCRAKDNL